MRVGNLAGRAVLVHGNRGLDIGRASDGRFPSDPQQLVEQWDGLRAWAEAAPVDDGTPMDPGAFGPPVPRPRQIFAVGLNYADHVEEAGLTVPDHALVFTKFVSSLTGPNEPVVIASPTVDWEVELVVVVGREAHCLNEEAAWGSVAGVMVGQDLSDRTVQMQGEPPQFSLGKSFPGFGPIGPAVVSVDELADPDDLELGCSVNGVTMQASRTSAMIFGVPELMGRLSSICTLYPGDLIFTGTPGGTNGSREDPRYLHPGDELVSWITGVGELRNVMLGAPGPSSPTLSATAEPSPSPSPSFVDPSGKELS